MLAQYFVMVLATVQGVGGKVTNATSNATTTTTAAAADADAPADQTFSDERTRIADWRLTESNNNATVEELITGIMAKIVDPASYNKWLRPNIDGSGLADGAVRVGLTMFIVSIDEVDLFNMVTNFHDVTLDFYLRQYWNDSRLAFGYLGYNRTIQPGHEFVYKVWRPDMFFVEERRADELNAHEYHRHDSFIRIKPNGQLMLSKRYSVTLRCPMDITLYPFDVQTCSMTLESYGHSTGDIKWYMYSKNQGPSVVFNGKGGLLSEYRVIPGVSYEATMTLSTGTYSQMIVPFSLVRLMGNYAIHVFVPCTMIVVISWIPFWTDRNAKVERLALGVTTVLTMTTLQAETNSQLPRVSYVRSIDIYMGTCFFLVFAALIECTIFGYLDRRYDRPSACPVVTRNAPVDTAKSPPNSSDEEEAADDDAPLHLETGNGSLAVVHHRRHHDRNAGNNNKNNNNNINLSGTEQSLIYNQNESPPSPDACSHNQVTCNEFELSAAPSPLSARHKRRPPPKQSRRRGRVFRPLQLLLLVDNFLGAPSEDERV